MTIDMVSLLKTYDLVAERQTISHEVVVLSQPISELFAHEKYRDCVDIFLEIVQKYCNHQLCNEIKATAIEYHFITNILTRKNESTLEVMLCYTVLETFDETITRLFQRDIQQITKEKPVIQKENQKESLDKRREKI